MGLGWLGVLQGAGGAAQRVTPGTGRREEALIHFWKTEPNRRIKSASRLRVVGLCGPQRSLSFGTIREPGLAWGRLRGPRPQAGESSIRGQTLNTKKDVIRVFPCFVCSVCVRRELVSRSRAQRYRVPGPVRPQTSDFFPCHSLLTSSPVRHTASRVLCCSSLAVGPPLR